VLPTPAAVVLPARRWIARLKKISGARVGDPGDQRLASSTPTRQPLVVHVGAFLAAALSG